MAPFCKGVPGDGIAGQVATIRFIAADGQVFADREALQRGKRQARIEMRMQDADLPRPRRLAAQGGRKAVNCENGAIIASISQGSAGLMIGRIKAGDALMPLGVGQVMIGRDHGTIIKAHDQGRVVQPPVRVDDKTRKIRRDHRAVKQMAKSLRHAERARIKGDVTLHLGFGQAEAAAIHPVRHMIGGVIAGDQPSSRT